MIKAFILILLIFSSISCDKGLEPPEETKKTYISGTIYINGGRNSWPPMDSVFAIRVAAFKENNPSNFFGDVVDGKAFITVESLQYLIDSSFVDSLSYTLEISESPVELNYIAVAWQYSSVIFNQKVAAVYNHSTHFEPSQVKLQPGDSLLNIDFTIDFKNLPPQPF